MGDFERHLSRAYQHAGIPHFSMEQFYIDANLTRFFWRAWTTYMREHPCDPKKSKDLRDTAYIFLQEYSELDANLLPRIVLPANAILDHDFIHASWYFDYSMYHLFVSDQYGKEKYQKIGIRGIFRAFILHFISKNPLLLKRGIDQYEEYGLFVDKKPPDGVDVLRMSRSIYFPRYESPSWYMEKIANWSKMVPLNDSQFVISYPTFTISNICEAFKKFSLVTDEELFEKCRKKALHRNINE